MPAPDVPSDGPRSSDADVILRDALQKALGSDIGPEAFFQNLGMNSEEVTLYRLHLLSIVAPTEQHAAFATVIEEAAKGMNEERRTFIENMARVALGIHHEKVAENLEVLRREFSDAMAKLRGEGTEPEPTPESSPEAHNFSRLLTDILADPRQKETLIKQLMLPNGRMWIDRRVRGTDGTEKTIRIWLSLNLTAAERAASTKEEEVALKQTIEDKLRNLPGSLRYRVDDLSSKDSWKAQWEKKKNNRDDEGLPDAIAELKKACVARQDVSEAVSMIATRIGLVEEENAARQDFTRLLTHYAKLSGAAMDLWTHVRNAYWHASEWKNDVDVSPELRHHDGTATVPRPTAALARIHLWQKIAEEPRHAEMEGKVARLSYNGVRFPPQSIVKTVVADGPQKGTWYQIGPHQVREEHLRISLRQDPPLAAGDPLTEEGAFELLAWEVPEPPQHRDTTPILEALGDAENFVPPTDDNLTEAWLRAHTGTKMMLKVHARETPRPIPCMISPNQTRASAGRIHLHYIKDNGARANRVFDIAELRRLNLPSR